MADEKPKNPASYNHPDAKRRMIPTAEQQGFVAEDEARPKKLRYPRNADLDPQFVWKGKDAEDLTDLLVDAPPIYKQEHIHPRAIIARLKAEAKKAEAGEEADDQMSMFAEFNGRPCSASTSLSGRDNHLGRFMADGVGVD